MSTKRASSMAKINNFATIDIKQAKTPDDAVAAFLGKPIPSTAPGTQPTTTKETITTDVAGNTVSDTIIKTGATPFDKTVTEVANVGQGLATGTYRNLERLPIPGGIGVPLVILLLLFLVLLPVNGHTRLMWLWLAVTGQAEIGQALTPPTLNTTTTGTTSYSNSSGGNPNQNTSNANTSTNSKSVSSSTKVIASSKKSTTIKTNTSKVHGGGPGPATDLPDPTAPIVQLSYSHLLINRNGYE